MKRNLARNLTATLGGLAAALACLSAAAQPGAAGARPATADCGRARDPARCEARQKALEVCRERRGAERRQCLEALIPPPDCAKAASPERCRRALAAREVCRTKPGPEQRQCLRERLKAAKPAER